MQPDDPDQKEHQRERALLWLERNWHGDRQCPICRANQWSIGDVVEVRPFNGGDLVLGGGGAIYPLFFVTCGSCGYTHSFNALISGVVRPGEPAPEEPAP